MFCYNWISNSNKCPQNHFKALFLLDFRSFLTLTRKRTSGIPNKFVFKKCKTEDYSTGQLQESESIEKESIEPSSFSKTAESSSDCQKAEFENKRGILFIGNKNKLQSSSSKCEHPYDIHRYVNIVASLSDIEITELMQNVFVPDKSFKFPPTKKRSFRLICWINFPGYVILLRLTGLIACTVFYSIPML